MSVIRNLTTAIRRRLIFKANVTNTSTLSSFSNILDSGFPDVPIPAISLPEYVFSKCEQFEQLTAIECGITGRRYSYGDLLKKSKYFSRALRKKLNLTEGDVVALLLPNIPEFPIATLGILRAGLVVTTLNPLYTPEEISRQLKGSSAKVLITLAEFWDTSIASRNIVKLPLPIIVIKTKPMQSLPLGGIDFGELTDNITDYPDPEPRNFDDVAFLPYSSGTTGFPKGVELTDYNVVASLCQHGSPDLLLIEEATQTHQDVIPVILPMFHIFGFIVNTLFALTKGVKLVTLSKFTPDDYISILRDHKPHVLFLVPPVVLFLAGHPMVKSEDFHSVRTIFCGAAPLGALDEQRLIEKAKKDVYVVQGYGTTEGCGLATTGIKIKDQFKASGSIGRPIPNTIFKVINVDDSEGIPLGPNTKGELLVKGPQVMKGYLNKPEETKSAFLDGWLRTGDMVYYNEERLVFVTDRLKELIKVKGFQVAPAELEEIIRDFPNVEDVAVVGVAHPTQGEVPRAYIVPKKDAKVNTKALEEYVKIKVADYKQLKGGIAVLDCIPKNASGKIMRRKLKLDYENSLQK